MHVCAASRTHINCVVPFIVLASSIVTRNCHRVSFLLKLKDDSEKRSKVLKVGKVVKKSIIYLYKVLTGVQKSFDNLFNINKPYSWLDLGFVTCFHQPSHHKHRVHVVTFVKLK